MRHPLIILLSCFMLVACNSRPPAPPSQAATPTATVSAALPGWTLVWQDEFDGLAIDTTRWSLEQNCWGGGNNEQQCYTNRTENVYVNNGMLHLVAQREESSGPALNEDAADFSVAPLKTLPYTSARLRSKHKGDWRYGRFEIRAKLPSGQGTWPAIWMLPSDQVYGAWPLSGEIDIMEAVNLGTVSDEPSALADERERRVYGTLHYGKRPPHNVYSGKSYKLPNGKSPADDFHTYAIEWQAGEIRWYVDGVHYATQRSSDWFTDAKQIMPAISAHAPFDQRFHLLLNLAVGGDWAGNVNDKGIDATVFPQTMLVDFVRVYQRP
jgi:beta-glucanase (GH16 family)